MEEVRNKSKLFKSGNSFGLRITKHDKEQLHARPGEEFEKVISTDGNSITFKKIKKVDDQTQKMIDNIFSEDHDLIEALKDL